MSLNRYDLATNGLLSTRKDKTMNRDLHRLWILLLFQCCLSGAVLLVPTHVHAEVNGMDLTGQETGFSSTLYNSTNGLPTSEANDIVQTDNGLIWIGSYSGLIRYDGNEFYRFDSSTGVSSVVCLYEDSRQRLWIGTNDNGIALYEDGEFRFFDKQNGLRSSSIRSIAEDGNGNILMATTAGIAWLDKNETIHMIKDPQINGKYICKLSQDAAGTIYGVTLDGELFTIVDLEIDAFYKKTDLGYGDVKCVSPDPANPGYVYIGMDNSAILYGDLKNEFGRYRVLNAAPQTYINDIYPTGSMVWVCADNGIGYLDPSMRYHTIDKLPLTSSVDSALIDEEGNAWFTSSRQGVMKISPSHFIDLNRVAEMENTVVNTTCLFGEDLYIGTDQGLYILNHKYEQVSNDLTELLADIRIRCILTDTQNQLWICTYSEYGLICYHADGTYETYNENNGLASNHVRLVKELSDGSILVSCSGGVHRIYKGIVGRHFDARTGINNTEILTIEEGKNGVLYFGSDGNGIYRIDGEEVTCLTEDDGLTSDVIMRIKKDPVRPDLYWIISSNSIAYMKDDQITTVTRFPYSNNFDLYFDGANGAWVLSSNGVYVTNVDSMLHGEAPQYTLYDVNCGLSHIATANSFSCLDPEGNLYISGTDGVTLINIHSIENDSDQVRLVIPYVEFDGKLVMRNEWDTIHIPPRCKRLTIYAYALTYSTKNPRVSCYLEGFDDEPQTMSHIEMKPVDYTNLESGEYVYHLALIDTLTGGEERSISVTFIKDKAFYEFLWFKLLMAALVLTVIICAANLHTRRKTEALLKKQKEDEIIIDQIIQAFAKCIDMKDDYTNGHSFRVAKYTRLLVDKMGYPEQEARHIQHVALLHDIGKISIPDEILHKNSRLTDEEFHKIQEHAQNGYEILKDIQLVPDIAIGAGYHHEHLDGSGYPKGLKGDEIPMIAQIIAVADTFDAMFSTRPYRKQMPIADVIAELRRVSGTQLNGDVVECLASLVDEGVIGNEKC